MKKKIIVHVSEVDISLQTGMGRVEYYWKQSFENAGFTFIHLGPSEVGKLRHKAFFPYKAYAYFKTLNIVPVAFIVHEPTSGIFTNRNIPCFVESHGVERNFWDLQLSGMLQADRVPNISRKTRFFYPLWRLRQCDLGLRKADKLLLINTDDKSYVQKNYKRDEKDIFIFKNGVTQTEALTNKKLPDTFCVLFNASWIERKGTTVFVAAAELLLKKGIEINYLLIGTGINETVIIESWPASLRPFVKVVAHFDADQELGFLSQASVVVLPSFFEGQPLSLLQAMAVSKCCIASNCCGQKDMITNGENGFLFEPGDATGLALAIEQCYNNPSLILQIGQNAKNYVKDRTWENVAEELVDFVVGNI